MAVSRLCVLERGMLCRACVEAVLEEAMQTSLYERGCVGTLEAVFGMLGLPWGHGCDLDK